MTRVFDVLFVLLGIGYGVAHFGPTVGTGLARYSGTIFSARTSQSQSKAVHFGEVTHHEARHSFGFLPFGGRISCDEGGFFAPL